MTLGMSRCRRRERRPQRPGGLPAIGVAVALAAIVSAAGLGWMPVTAGPEDAQTALQQALRLLAGGDTVGAERALQSLAREHPASWKVRLELGRFLSSQRRLPEALPHLEEAARRAPDEFETRSALGQAYALSEQLGPAEREFRAAAALRPADPLSHFNLGRIYRIQERYEEALPEFERALQGTADPQRLASVHQNLALVLRSLKRPSQAVPHLEAYLAARPEQRDSRMQLATLYFDLGNYNRALEQVDGVLEGGPSRPDAHYLRGMLLKIKARNSESIASFRAALAADSGFLRARYQLATVLNEEGGWQEAAALLRTVLAAEPEHPNAHYLLSTALRALERPQEAEKELQIHNRIAQQQRSRSRTTAAGPEP